MCVASLENDAKTLKEMSYDSLVIALGALGEGVTDTFQLDGGVRMPASQSLNRERGEDYIPPPAMVSVLSMFGFKTCVERVSGVSRTPLDVRCQQWGANGDVECDVLAAHPHGDLDIRRSRVIFID